MMVILLGMPHYAAFSRFVRLIGFTLHYRFVYVYQVYYLRSTLLAVLLIVFHQDDRHAYYIHAVRLSKSIVLLSQYAYFNLHSLRYSKLMDQGVLNLISFCRVVGSVGSFILSILTEYAFCLATLASVRLCLI